MRFLVDTNLPRALAAWITAKGHVAEHVLDVALAQSKDVQIWRHAASINAIIVSKDADFAEMTRSRSDGAGVIWIRTGNGTTLDLIAFLSPIWPAVEAELARGERLIEVR